MSRSEVLRSRLDLRARPGLYWLRFLVQPGNDYLHSFGGTD